MPKQVQRVLDSTLLVNLSVFLSDAILGVGLENARENRESPLLFDVELHLLLERLAIIHCKHVHKITRHG